MTFSVCLHMRFARIDLKGICSKCRVGRHTLHHREISRVAWGPWLMDPSQDWPGGSAKHLRWSSAALCWSEPPVWSRFRTIWRFLDLRGSDNGMRDDPETRPDGRFRRTKGSHCGGAGEPTATATTTDGIARKSKLVTRLQRLAPGAEQVRRSGRGTRAVLWDDQRVRGARDGSFAHDFYVLRVSRTDNRHATALCIQTDVKRGV